MYIGILLDSTDWKKAMKELETQKPIIFGEVKPSPFVDVDMKGKKFLHIIECESIVNDVVKNPRHVTCYSAIVSGTI